MLRVKTSLKPSRIHGLGLFAEERIPRGTVVWLYEAGLDLRFWPEDVEDMAPEARAFLARYAYCEHDTLVLCGDHARFMNHSPEATCGNNPERTATLALRDIEPGEELTDNYATMEDPWTAFEGLIESELLPRPPTVH
ncbi:SET domain-containing protein [Corallococcus terminator]|uniref:SET domain-containing protein-lysine N-methyltransferase n=1 Tax=Corallococcus terminator TaxID=2316733 RepID=A0A3A8IYW4_9BACT|nr:SET domain-containing protein [Corallococcus terminator]RKG83521.1 SET domain-containing protein-lysine N-methyltransferase [Corallococcus terminator]